MQQNFNNITYIVGNEDILRAISSVRVFPICDESIIDFLTALSRDILQDNRTKKHPDVSSYAFWIRKSSIEGIRNQYSNSNNRIGRGVSFHIAPSNVPVNFAVSMTYALLAGNPCIVRISNKQFEQVDIICDVVNKLVNTTFPKMADNICVIRYEHDEVTTQALTSICDIRVIWGGNRTIDNIRLAKLPPRAIELSFADRHSIVVINSDEYLKADRYKVARDFYIDTYFSDQNACSSPRMVIWMGENVEKARTIFWRNLEDLLVKKYMMSPIQSIDKLTALCRFAANHTKVSTQSNSNLAIRVVLSEISDDTMNFKESGGYFFEYTTKNLEDIVPLLSKSCQTISYLGVNPDIIRKIVFSLGTKGVDRIVPMGKTMDISFVWDGYNMIEAMSRIVDCS